MLDIQYGERMSCRRYIFAFRISHAPDNLFFSNKSTAPGTTPPSVSSRSHSHSDGTTTTTTTTTTSTTTTSTTTEFNGIKVGGSRGNTLEQLAQAKKKQQSSATNKTRPRPLPLRKRKFVMKDSDDEELPTNILLQNKIFQCRCEGEGTRC